MSGAVLHILALQTAWTSEAALPTASASFPAGRTLGKRIPYPWPSFPLAFSKNQKTEKTGRMANPNGEPPSRSASLGSLQPTTPNPIDRGKPQGKKVSCRGTRLLSADCREVPGEGALSGGLSSHSVFIKKFPVHDPSGSSQGVSLNSGVQGLGCVPSSRRQRPVLCSGLTGLEIPRA